MIIFYFLGFASGLFCAAVAPEKTKEIVDSLNVIVEEGV